METTMKKTSSPIVREYKIGDITYIVKAVIKDGAKEDAVTNSCLSQGSTARRWRS